MLTIIFLLIAAILFAFGAFNIVTSRYSLISVGLFALVLAQLLPLLFH